MPTSKKLLWIFGLSSLAYIFSSFEYADSIAELTESEKIEGTINSVECKDGSRSFMKQELTFLTNKAEVEFKFNKEGECSKLVYFYKSASSFEAVQINTLLSSHVFSLKIDGVEQYDFVEQKNDYNYYILFSPFIVPLFMAIGSTVNWSRGRWRK